MQPSLTPLPKGTRYRNIGDKIAIHKYPEYPGVTLTAVIEPQEAFCAVATVTVDGAQNNRPTRILFYQLADGRGWVHDPSSQSGSKIVCERQYRYVGQECVPIRKTAAFPGTRTNATVSKNEMFWARTVAAVHHQCNDKSVSVLLYELADGRGWVPDFCMSKPGEPLVFPEDAAACQSVEVKLDGELQELQEDVIACNIASRTWVKQHLRFKYGQLAVFTEKGGSQIDQIPLSQCSAVLFPANFEGRLGLVWGIVHPQKGMHVFEAASEDKRIYWIQICLQAGAKSGGTATEMVAPPSLTRSNSSFGAALNAAGKAVKFVATEMKRSPSSPQVVSLRPFQPLVGSEFARLSDKGPYAKLAALLKSAADGKAWLQCMKQAIESERVVVTNHLVAFASVVDGMDCVLWCDFAQTRWRGSTNSAQSPFIWRLLQADSQSQLTYELLLEGDRLEAQWAVSKDSTQLIRKP